jgi:hypothetical protein
MKIAENFDHNIDPRPSLAFRTIGSVGEMEFGGKNFQSESGTLCVAVEFLPAVKMHFVISFQWKRPPWH